MHALASLCIALLNANRSTEARKVAEEALALTRAGGNDDMATVMQDALDNIDKPPHS